MTFKRPKPPARSIAAKPLMQWRASSSPRRPTKRVRMPLRSAARSPRSAKTAACDRSPFVEDEERRRDGTGKPGEMIPADRLIEIPNRESGEDEERDDLL